MAPIDFTIDTKVMDCSYNLSKNGLLTCLLDDPNGIQREAASVSFLFVEPNTKYQSSLYYKYLDAPNKKTGTFTYEFNTPVFCRVLGSDTTSTIKCQDR